MKLKKIEFHQGQAVAVNTYNTIMINAFQLMQATATNFKGSIFDDFINLYNDKTQDKVELANEINREMTAEYQGNQGLYAKADLKEAGSEYTFEWLANVNNKASETVRAFNKVNFSIC